MFFEEQLHLFVNKKYKILNINLIDYVVKKFKELEWTFLDISFVDTFVDNLVMEFKDFHGIYIFFLTEKLFIFCLEVFK